MPRLVMLRAPNARHQTESSLVDTIQTELVGQQPVDSVNLFRRAPLLKDAGERQATGGRRT